MLNVHKTVRGIIDMMKTEEFLRCGFVWCRLAVIGEYNNGIAGLLAMVVNAPTHKHLRCREWKSTRTSLSAIVKHVDVGERQLYRRNSFPYTQWAMREM
jgi:hypothetical protein